MAGYQRIEIIGNLTRDLELKYIPSGTALAKVGIAVNDKTKRNGEYVDDVTFFNLVFWGKRAETACKYLHKGSWLFVTGKIKFSEYEKKDGTRVKTHEVSVGEFVFGPRQGGYEAPVTESLPERQVNEGSDPGTPEGFGQPASANPVEEPLPQFDEEVP